MIKFNSIGFVFLALTVLPLNISKSIAGEYSSIAVDPVGFYGIGSSEDPLSSRATALGFCGQADCSILADFAGPEYVAVFVSVRGCLGIGNSPFSAELAERYAYRYCDSRPGCGGCSIQFLHYFAAGIDQNLL